MVVLGAGQFLMSEATLYCRVLVGFVFLQIRGHVLHISFGGSLMQERELSPVNSSNSPAVQGHLANTPLLGPYSRTMPRAQWWPWGGLFLMSEIPLYT